MQSLLPVARCGQPCPGVPAAARERVFERFARLKEGWARDGGGTGLGLAIVREVVVAHGGSVTVDGAPGARFVINRPRSVPES